MARKRVRYSSDKPDTPPPVAGVEKSGVPIAPETAASIPSPPEMLQLVMDNIPQYVFWKNRGSVYQGCNRNFARAAGVGDPSNIVGKTDFDLPWRREEAEFFVKCDQQVVESGQSLYQIVEPQQQADGRQAWVETNKIPLRNDSGQVIGILGTYQDITERKQAQEALQQSEQRYRMLAESAEDSIFIIDRKFNVQYVNRYGAAQLGRRVDDVAGRNLTELFPPDIVVRFRCNLGRVFDSGKTITLETRTVFPTGEHWLDTQLIPLLYATGEVMAVMGLSRDITEQKQAELALRTSEASYHAIFNSVNDAILVYSIETGEILEANDRLLELSGYTLDELRQMNVPRLAAESGGVTMQRIQTQMKQAAAGEIQLLEMLAKHKSGRKFWVEVNFKKAVISGQERVLAVLRDIDDRKRAEDALHESSQLYRSLVEMSPDAVVVTDSSGKITMANRQAMLLHRFERIEDMLGREARNLIAPEDQGRAAQLLGDTYDSGSVRSVAFKMLRCNGESFAAELSSSSILDSHGHRRYRIHIARDVTERNKLQRQLLQSQKLESIGTLAGGIAHDFNNLLAVIIGNVSMLQRDQSLPARVKDALNDVMYASERGSALTHQLLAYARSGLQAPAPTDLNRLVESVLRILKRTAPVQIELTAQLKSGLPPVMADATQIEQVLMNLTLNAIQASTPPAVIEISTGVEAVDVEQAKILEIEPGEYVQLRVVDHGCGMDAVTQERIFEPFFTTKPTGRGMGLAASLGIVQSHKGCIRSRSNPGEGTTMLVYLPADRRGAVKTPPAIKKMHAPRGSETILIIDDQSAVAHTIEQILASLGYCVIVHTDIDEARSFLNTNAEDLDLVLLDLNLPQCSGEEVMLHIHRDWPHLPVLLTSGSQAYETLSSEATSRAVGFLAKPFSIMEIATLLRRVFDERAETQQNTDVF